MTGAHAIDETVRPLLASVVRYGLALLVIVLALGQLGVQTASLLTVLGAAGLAIGLALQGTLSNIAAGIMLLFLRPFKVGDYIEVVMVNAISGTVLEIGLFGCVLRTYDGILVFAPNGTIWNNPLKNHTRNAGRLVSVAVTVEDTADLERARAGLLSMMRDDPRIHKEPPPDVFIENYGPNGVALNCRAWASPSAFGAVQRTLIEEAKRRIDSLSDGKPAVKQVARVVPPDNDPSRLIHDGDGGSLTADLPPGAQAPDARGDGAA